MKFEKAERLKVLPPYPFAELDEAKQAAQSRGIDVIDFGVGDPDLPTNNAVIEALYKAAKDPKNHRYPSYTGLLEFREAAARWYKKRFNVDLDPKKEVLSLIGSKEGIGHIILGFINPDEYVLVPDPGYPVYKIGTIFSQGKVYKMPLKEGNRFLPDLDAVPEEIAEKSKMMFINYPNNPTGFSATKEFYEKLIHFAKKHNIIVCSDNAYSEIYYNEEERPLSILEIEGAKETAVEFHSLSKTYNMTGWRIGFAVGNSEILSGLGGIKTNLDSGIFQAIQYAGIEALDNGWSWIEENRKIYKKRMDILYNGLKELGWDVKYPDGTFYLWYRVPKNYNSKQFAKKILDEAGIVITPGPGLGEYGEGYVRFSITMNEEKIIEAIERIRKITI